MRVEPDGPVPCDLAAVGESPGKKEVELGRGFVGPSGRVLWGGEDLIGSVVGRERPTVYVTNVCKVPMPDPEWNKLTRHQQGIYYAQLREELEPVRPKVVLAFGRRACGGLYPAFRGIKADQGTPKWDATESFIVMPLWHPAAYLRGNSQALTDLAVALSDVPVLLEASMPKPLRHGPPLPWTTTDEALGAWPSSISFMELAGNKKLKCTLCGERIECGQYKGKELKWNLCLKHAILTAQWAETNEKALQEHNTVEEAYKKDMTIIHRAAERMESRMRSKWIEDEVR